MFKSLKRVCKKPFIHYAKNRGKFIFTLSTGRVGTVSLTNMMNLSENCLSDHEPQSQFLEQTKEAYHHQNEYMNQSDKFIEKYLESRIFTHSNSSQLRKSLLMGKTYSETSNRLTYIAPLLNKSLKNTKFIFLYRHPAEVVRSGMRRDYYNTHPWDEYRITPNSDDLFYDEWGKLDQFDKCCWYWRGVNEFSLKFVKSLPCENIFKLKSEDLFEPNIEKITELFEWAKVQMPQKDKLIDLLSKPLNKQSEGDFPFYEDWSQKQKDRLKLFAGDLSKDLGYTL